MTLREKVEFIFLGQDFDFHTATHALPGTFQQIGFQFSQAAPWEFQPGNKSAERLCASR